MLVNKYIALLDVLGFKKGVNGYGFQKYLLKYVNALNIIIDSKISTRSDKFNYIILSDSIIITTNSDTKKAFSSLIELCSRLIYSLVCNKIPIRGAISYGPVMLKNIGQNPGNIFLAGPAVVEAYELEKRQDWIGISFSESVISKHFEYLNLFSWSEPIDRTMLFFQECKIPLKTSDGNIEELSGYAIFPRSPLSTNASSNNFLKSLNYLKASCSTIRDSKKYSKTIDFINDVHLKYANATEEEL